MPLSSFVQSSFEGGEWSKTAQGQIADPRYKVSLSTCLNNIPMDTKSVTRRPGSQHAGISRAGAPARVYSLKMTGGNPYTMEFTDGHLRFWQGATLITTNDANTIASVTNASPSVFTTGIAHGWSTGDGIVMPNTGNALLDGRQLFITVTGTTTFTATDAVTGSAINSISSINANAVVKRALDVATTYSAQAWKSVRVVQAELSTIILHGQIAPQQLNTTALPTANTSATFALTAALFLDGPYYDPVAGNATITPSTTNGNVTMTVGFPTYDSTRSYSVGDFVVSSNVNYQSLTNGNVGNTPASSPSSWAAVSAGIAIGPNGFQGSDVGRHIRLFSEPALWAVGTSYTAGNVVAYVNTSGNTAYYTCLTNNTAALTNAPGVSAATWGVNAAGAIWTWGRITGLANLISPGLAGSVEIGNSTFRTGNAFDGNTNQDSSHAEAIQGNNVFGLTLYVGKNYSGASAQKIGTVTVFPASDVGFTTFPSSGGPGVSVSNLTINLRAKQTAPSGATDGTILGTYNGGATNVYKPVTITSSDQSTSWNYVWVEIVIGYAVNATTWTPVIYCAECQFFTPTGSGSGTGVTVQIVGPALLYTTPIRTWRLGLYSGTTGYPTCGTYHEGRLWLSGAVANRIDGSVPVSVNQQGFVPSFSFAPTASDGTVTDASAIDYTFDAPDVNTIYWMEPDQQGIICGTAPGEWLVQASAQNNVLTPTSIQAHRITKIGCANIEPRRTNHTLVFVQRFGRSLMEYFADVFSGKLSAPNLAERARHITKPGIAEIAYQHEIAPIIWARGLDGTLFGTTYRRDTLMTSQGPNINGWHRHTLGSGRTVESIASGTSVNGVLDALMMVTNDATTNVRHIEVITDLWEEGSDIKSAFFVDNGIVPPSYTTSIVLGGASGIVINGLWDLNGKTVSVFAGGLDLGDWTVSNGAVNVPFAPSTLQTNSLFTQAFVSAFSGAMTIVVGFTFTSQGQLLRPDTQPESGARSGPGFGKERRVHKAAANLVDTQGVYFGTKLTDARMHKASLRTDGGGSELAANVLYTGIWRDTVADDTQGFDGRIAWQTKRPFPTTVAALGGFLETVDS